MLHQSAMYQWDNLFQAIVRNQEEYSCMKATQIENIPKNICQDVLPCKSTTLKNIKIPNGNAI